MRMGIIGGGGGVGSAIAFHLATLGWAQEVALVDLKPNVATAHAMDAQQAVSALTATKLEGGDWSALSGCEIVVMAAGAPQHNSLQDNLAILDTAGKHIVSYCPQAIVIVVTNPVDILTYVLRDLTGLPAKQFIGCSLNDSARLRTAIAQLLHVPAADVRAMVIGEHGQGMVPLFSQVQVSNAKVRLTAEQQSSILSYLKNWFSMYNGLKANRTAAWTTAVSVGELVRLIVMKSQEPSACSAILDGQYGIAGVSVGVPVVLGASGIERIVELPLTQQERESLQVAAVKLAAVLKGLSWGSKSTGARSAAVPAER